MFQGSIQLYSMQLKISPQVSLGAEELKATLIFRSFLLLSTNIALLRFSIDSTIEGKDSKMNLKQPEQLGSKHSDQQHKFQLEVSHWCCA